MWSSNFLRIRYTPWANLEPAFDALPIITSARVGKAGGRAQMRSVGALWAVPCTLSYSATRRSEHCGGTQRATLHVQSRHGREERRDRVTLTASPVVSHALLTKVRENKDTKLEATY